MKQGDDENWLFFLSPEMQATMRGRTEIQVQDPLCKRSKRTASENYYNHGS
jgi:hypothetical protein